MLDFSSSLTLIFKLTFHISHWHFITCRREVFVLAWGKDKKDIFFLLLRSPKIVIDIKDGFEVHLYTPRLFSPKLKSSPPQPNPARGPLLFLSNSFGLLQYFPWGSYNCNVIHGYSWFLWDNYVMISSSRPRTSISRVMIAMNHKPPRPDYVNLNVSNVQI